MSELVIKLSAEITSAAINAGKLEAKEIGPFLSDTMRRLSGGAIEESEIDLSGLELTHHKLQSGGKVTEVRRHLDRESDSDLFVEKFPPAAVSIEDSLADPEYIVSMLDGQQYKTLGRHLSSRGIGQDEYRRHYGLPHDYPMIAPAYSEKRAEIAREIGLGKGNKKS